MAVLAIFCVFEETAGGIFDFVVLQRTVPSTGFQHFVEMFFGLVVLFSGGKIPIFADFVKFVASQLSIAETVFFVSQIEAKKAVGAVSAVVQKCGISAVFAVEEIKTGKTSGGICEVGAQFGVE